MDVTGRTTISFFAIMFIPPSCRLFLVPLVQLLQFDQHAVGALGAQEGDQAPVLRLASRLVEQFDSFGLELPERRLDVVHTQADVVDPLAALLDELGSWARRIHRL